MRGARASPKRVAVKTPAPSKGMRHKSRSCKHTRAKCNIIFDVATAWRTLQLPCCGTTDKDLPACTTVCGACCTCTIVEVAIARAPGHAEAEATSLIQSFAEAWSSACQCRRNRVRDPNTHLTVVAITVALTDKEISKLPSVIATAILHSLVVIGCVHIVASLLNPN